jgi:hypothetical protein
MNVRTISLIFFTTIIPATASARIVLDQIQNKHDLGFASFDQADLAQSFTTTANNVAGGGIFLLEPISGSGAGTITFGLWTALPNVAGTVELAHASVTIAGINKWTDAFWSPVTITPGATYYLTFDDGNSQGVLAGAGGDPYPNGNAFANAGYGSFPSFDYTFRTYTDNGVVTPEPSTWAMMLLGFAGLGFAGYRRARIGKPPAAS